MQMHRYIIALGSNLGERADTMRKARSILAEEYGQVLASSGLYRSAAVIHPDSDYQDQSDYLNAAILFKTELGAVELLKALQQIERRLGRMRESENTPWPPRYIDLDIVSAGTMTLSTESLTIPHPEAAKRDFVLLPIADIQPDFQHPLSGQSLPELISQLCTRSILEKCADEF